MADKDDHKVTHSGAAMTALDHLLHAVLSAAAIRWARFEAVRRGLVPDVWKETTPPPVAAAL